MLGWGLGIGAQIIIARRDGEKNFLLIGKTLEHSQYIFIVLGIIAFIILRFISTPLFTQIIESKAVCQASTDFLKYRSWGIFFAFTNVSFRAFYIGTSNTKIISWSTIAMAVINIILDYLLIFGNFGFPKMGIQGAALASVIAEGVATLSFIIYTFVKADIRKYAIFQYTKPDFKLLKNIFTISFPMMMQNFISLSGWFLFFIFVEKMGEQSLAISNIIRSIYLVFMIPIWGFSSAANTLVSYIIGQGNTKSVFRLTKKIITLCAFSVFIIVAITNFFPFQIISIYSTDLQLITNTIPAFKIISGAAPLIGISFIIFSVVSGTGRTNVSFIIEVIVIALYLLGTYLMVNFITDKVEIVWCMEYFYALSIGSISILYLKFGNWKDKSI